MPHSNPEVSTFERSNGNFSLSIIGHPKVGLPYGTYPRLLLSWLVTEAVRTKKPELALGNDQDLHAYILTPAEILRCRVIRITFRKRPKGNCSDADEAAAYVRKSGARLGFKRSELPSITVKVEQATSFGGRVEHAIRKSIDRLSKPGQQRRQDFLMRSQSSDRSNASSRVGQPL